MNLSRGLVRLSFGGSLAFLTACGGGGGSSDPTESPVTDLSTTGIAAPATANAGEAVTATVTVSNSGTEAIATPFETKVYLSLDSTISSDDEFIGSGVVDALDAGASTTVTASYTLPANLRSGTYYLGAVADAGGVVDESDEANNLSQVALDIAGGTCSADAYEDDDTASAANTLPMNTPQAHDHCDGDADWLVFSATAGTAYSLTTSDLGVNADTRIEVYDTDATSLLATSGEALEPNASRLAWTAPSDGDYYLKVVADTGLGSTGPDTGYTLLLGEATSDLGVVDATLNGTTSLSAGGIGSATLTLFNEGFAPSGSFVVKAYLSSDGTIDGQDTVVGSATVPDLAAGQTTQIANLEIAIPKGTVAGTYSLAFMADADNSVAEYNEGNNVGGLAQVSVAAASCALDAYEDDDFSQYAAALTYGSIQEHNFCDDQRDWLSFDAVEGQPYLFEIAVGSAGVSTIVYDGAETSLVGWDVAANTSASNTFVAPATGTYYLLATTTGGGAGSDYSVTAYDSLPDLLPGTLSSDAGAVLGGILNVTVTTRNDGLADAGASETGIYLSTDPTIDQGDLLLGTVPVQPLLAGTTDTMTVALPVPVSLAEGTTYYIGMATDVADQVTTEVNEGNNVTASANALSVYAPPCGVDGNEQNDFIGDATSITTESDIALNYCDDAYDWLQVDLTQNTGTGYLLNAIGASTSFDIYDSDRKTVLLQDASSLTYWEPPANGGTYYVLAKESSGSPGLDTGYTLNVSRCDKDGVEPDDTPDTASLIQQLGLPQSRNMCDDGHDVAAFEANAGSLYIVTVVPDSQGFTPRVSISDGQTNVATDDSSPGSLSWVALSNATYYVVVDGNQGLNTGYTVTLDGPY